MTEELQETVSREDFEDVSWQDEIDSADEQSVDKYSRLFFEKSNELEEKEDTKSARAYRFLGDICSMYLKDNDPNEPFGPEIVTANGRTAILEDFTDEHVELLNYLLEKTTEPELKARIADILWTTQRDHKAGEKAFRSYLDSSDILHDPESWYIGFERMRRAFEIAAMLGNEELKSNAEDFAIEKLDEHEGKDPKFFTLSSIGLLADQDYDNLADLAQRSEKAAEFAETEEKWRKAKQLWMLKAKMERSRGEAGEVVNAETRAGEAIIEEANAARDRSHGVAASHLADAVEVFRRAGKSEKAESAHEAMLKDQEKSTDEMGLIETEVDLTDAATEAREAVSGDKLINALRTFSTITAPPKKQNLEQEAEDLIENHPLSAVIPNTILDGNGKIVAKRGSVTDPDAEEEVIKAEVIRASQRWYRLAVYAGIVPAFEQIARDHRITLRDLVNVCQYDPMVPPGRELIFARGLYHGFQKDYISACSVLVPQIEHFLRYLLMQEGVTTSSLQSDGTQEEFPLNTLLHMDETEEILGEDTVFTLNSLLNSKFGSNFRHRIAHGLLDSSQFGSTIGIYTWWLILHLIFRPIVAGMNDEDESSREEQDKSEE